MNKIFYFVDNVFYLEVLVLCHKMGAFLEYMVLEPIYKISPDYYRIYGNKCPFKLYNLTQTCIVHIPLLKCKFYP